MSTAAYSVRGDESEYAGDDGSHSRSTTTQESPWPSTILEQRQEYTTLSSMGVGMPRSPRLGSGRGPHSGGWLFDSEGEEGSSGVKAVLYALTELLHPAGGRNAPREGDEDDADATREGPVAGFSLSNTRPSHSVEEGTPLLRPQQSAQRQSWWSGRQSQSSQPQQQQESVMRYGSLGTSASLRRKYVGECCCDPLEPITMQQRQSQTGQDGSSIASQSMQPEVVLELRAAQAEKLHTIGVSLATMAQVCFALMSMLAARYSTVLWEQHEYHGLTPIVPQSIWLSRTWLALSTAFVCSILVKTFRVPGGLLGTAQTRRWIWGRAAISAFAVTLFTLASSCIPMADLVAIVYLAPMFYVLASHLLFTSQHPFRAQLVSLSIYLGLLLVTQPTFLFSMGSDSMPPRSSAEDDFFVDGDAVAAMPLDLAPMAGLDIVSFRLPIPWAWAAVAGSTLLSILSFAMLDRRPEGAVTYQSTAANGIIVAVVSLAMHLSVARTGTDGPTTTGATSTQSAWSSLAMLSGTGFFYFLAHIFQDLASRYSAVCQMGLIAFVQPVISTGLGFIFPDVGSDPLCLAGVVLILANVAWTWTPLSEDELLEEYI